MRRRAPISCRIGFLSMMLCMAFGHVPSIVTGEEISVGPCVATQRCQGPIREPVRHEQVVSKDQERSFAGTVKTSGATVLDNAAYLVTSPLRMDLESGLITAGVVGAVGGVMAFDSNIQKWVQRNHSQSGNDFFDRVRTVGNAALPVNVGLAAGGYLFREHEEGNKLFQTSLVSLEAQMLAGGLTQMAKFAIGRDRPSQDPQGNSYDPFQKIGQAFPSGHSTQMFALAAVFSEQYSLPVQVLVYSLAIAVSAERVYDNQHFTSDVLAGAAIGYVVGKALAWRHTYGDKGLSFLPLDTAGGIGLTLQYRL